MKRVIGFATEYYTLWYYEAEPTYVIDAYGKYHQSGINHKYFYIQNISKDINKVKTKYPGVHIDETLRGQHRSFSYKKENLYNLPGEYFWVGKYSGHLVDEVIKHDLNYCIWAANEFSNNTSDFIKAHPTYIEHFDNLKRKEEDLIKSAPLLKVGDMVELQFTTNGYNLDEDEGTCWTMATYKGMDVYIECSYFRRVDGMYPYIMPGINGKPRRTKNKTFMVVVTDIILTKIEYGKVVQYIKVK